MENWLRIFAHDEGEGVWDIDNQALNPHDLPISDDLGAMLNDWINAYRCREEWNPGASRKSEKFRDFARDGLLVAQAFKTELPNWTIVYHDAVAEARRKKDDVDGHPCQYEVVEPASFWPMRWGRVRLHGPAGTG